MQRVWSWSIVALGLIGCAKPDAGTGTPVLAPAPASGTTASTGDATLVVVGRVRVSATRDGHVGQVTVSRVVRGALGSRTGFVSEPLPLDEGAEGVLFLVPEGEGLRLLPLEGRLVTPVAQAEDLLASAPPPPPPVPSAYDSDLATVRSFDQQAPWTPQSQPPKVEAARVFAEIVWIGRTEDEVLRLLGAPMQRSEKAVGTVWEYAYHSGEHGIVRWLVMNEGRVTSMFVVPTQ